MTTKLGEFQRKHFNSMKPDELREVIRDANRQLDYIACAATEAADHKRDELQARIDYCKQLLGLL